MTKEAKKSAALLSKIGSDPAMALLENKHIPIGRVVLKRAGEIIWIGNLSDPWDDVDFDTAIVSPRDYTMLKLHTMPAATSPQIICCGCGGSPVISFNHASRTRVRRISLFRRRMYPYASYMPEMRIRALLHMGRCQSGHAHA